MKIYSALIAVLLIAPHASFASVSFSEIMYDAPGTDAKHEWVEVVNEGGPVDLGTYKLFENGSNHGLTLVAGSASLAAGQRAIIADDAAIFKGDSPSYSGTLFDSAFSLANSGEELTLRDPGGADVDVVQYSTEDGAAGDGESLHLVNGHWEAGTPSPGKGAQGASKSVAVTPQQSTQVLVLEEAPTITVSAGEDRVIVVGAGAVFTATAFGIKGEEIKSAQYIWYFGNGASKEGKSVLYAYAVPGTYTVTIDAVNAGFSATDRVAITVVPADIVVTRADAPFVEIENNTAFELDLGLWQVVAGTASFVLPRHTVVGAGESISFPASVTGLNPRSAKEVAVYYPNGVRAAEAPPEVLFMPDTNTVMYTEPQVQSARESVQQEATSTSYSEQLTAAIGNTSPEWAWLSFVVVAALILAGLGALVYLGRKS